MPSEINFQYSFCKQYLLEGLNGRKCAKMRLQMAQLRILHKSKPAPKIVFKYFFLQYNWFFVLSIRKALFCSVSYGKTKYWLVGGYKKAHCIVPAWARLNGILSGHGTIWDHRYSLHRWTSELMTIFNYN